MNNVTDSLSIKGRVIIKLHNIKTGQVKIKEYINTFVNTGKYAIARRLINENSQTNECIVTYGAIGTGTNAPSVSDTALQTEIDREIVASTSRINNASTMNVFYTTSQANGNLTEFGLFGEGASATPGSGTLFNRVVISITKTSSETMTITCTLTIG